MNKGFDWVHDIPGLAVSASFLPFMVWLFLLFPLSAQTISSPQPVSASSQPWPGTFTQLDFDCGGYVTGFAAHPGGRLYAKANVGGLYRSDDHGATWQWLSAEMTGAAGQMPQGVAVDPENPDLVVQATGTSYFPADPSRGIWKSANAGGTWKQVLAGVNFSGNDEAMYGGPCLIFQPSNHRELWTISRGDGLWSSVDGGDTWVRRDGGLMNGFVGTAVAIHPDFPDQIWVAGEGGLWFSADHGASWSKVRVMGRCFRVQRLDARTVLLAGGNQGKPVFLRITALDWAKPAAWTWQDCSTRFADCRAELPCLTILRDGQTIIAGSQTITKVSTDRGQNWKTLPMVLDTSGDQPFWQRRADTSLPWGRNEILQDPLDPRRWYLGSGFDLLVSADAGATWRHSGKGIAMTCTYKAIFHPDDPDLVVVPAMDQYALIIRDGGISGTAQLCLVATSAIPGVASGAQVLWHGQSAILLYTRYGQDGARLGITHDAWKTWAEVVPRGIPLEAFSDGVLSAGDPQDFLVVAGDVSGVGKGGVYRTRDGGRNFVQARGIPDGVHLGYYFSLFGYHDIYADPRDGATRYFWVNGAGFYGSRDGGSSWARSGWGIPGKFGQLAMDQAGTLWLMLESRQTGTALYRSADGGENWRPVGDFTSTIPRVDANGDWVVVSGQRPGDSWNKLYLSGDRGASWREITRPGYRFPTVNGLALNPHRPGQVWISTNGRSNAVFTPDPGLR